jgi:hypothetical protein
MNNNWENTQASINHKKYMPFFSHKIVFSLGDTITIVSNNPHHVLFEPLVTTLPPY